MSNVIAIVGYSDSGKTTLVESLLRELTGRGLKVGTIKHTHHLDQTSGKDTDRHLAAGASATILHDPDGFQLTKAGGKDIDPAGLAETWLADCDLILAEGYKSSGLPRIEIFRADLQTKLITTDQALLLAVTGERPPDLGDVQFVPAEDIARLADLALERAVRPAKPPLVSLRVDSRRVPIKFFVRDIFDQVIRGLVSTLKGAEDAGRIDLVLKKSPQKDDPE